MSALRIDVAPAYVPLLKPSRFKGAHGGRGSGKSHFFAEMLIARCLSAKTRAVCIREVQNTIKESVRQLLIDKIAKFKVGDRFEVLDAEIRGPHGSLIIFKGMQSYNAESIKSLEGYDIAWVEEAQTLSAVSLRMLRPTIRAPGSEIWFSWNPRHDTDPVDVFLRENRPENAIVVRANWNNNPWFPAELTDELELDFKIDPQMASHVWNGDYEIVSEGTYYAHLIAEAENEGRISDFPYDPALPVLTAWDIGVDDYMAIWCFQENGEQVRAIDYFEASGEGADAAALWLFNREYKYERHFLPHDVMVREWGAGARTRLETLQGLGIKPVNVGVATNPAERINASRKLIPCMSFDRQRCALGIKRLRGYRRKLNQQMQVYTGPLHDESSHGADAYGEFAINCRIVKRQGEQKPKVRDMWAPQTETSSDWKVA